MPESNNTKKGISDNSGKGIESTVDIFANRIARKLKQREVEQTESEKAAEVRHALILEGMTTIRKALQETLRINLGDRFALDLDIDDYKGWPRVQLLLLDSLAPEQLDHGIIVSAHERNEMGTIEIHLAGSRCLGRVHLTDRRDFEKLGLVVKKSVREFLDIISTYILNPVRPQDLIAQQTKALEASDEDFLAENLAEEDVFTEDFNKNDNIIVPQEEAPAVPTTHSQPLGNLDFSLTKEEEENGTKKKTSAFAHC
ncbi:MAG: hypothetical protein KDD53_04175 [Bdellovibrionales bacterium]|nr:hypothetical protein [Bdellovibrionales bacterium]